MDTAQKPLVIALLGEIGVGKSFFARQLAPKISAVRLVSDAARKAMFGVSFSELSPDQQFFGKEANDRLFGLMDYAVRQILANGTSVIYESGRFNGRSNREILRKIADETDARLVFVWVHSPREVAKERVLTRETTSDQIQVDEETAAKIFKFHDKHFDAPRNDEFVIKIDGTVPFEEQFAAFQKSLEDINGPIA